MHRIVQIWIFHIINSSWKKGLIKGLIKITRGGFHNRFSLEERFQISAQFCIYDDQRMPWPFRSYDLFRPIIIEIVPVNQPVTLEPVALAVFRGTRV